jgi:2'-5' RNA ligase
MSAGNKTASRVFLALWPDETTRSRLIDVVGLLKKGITGKWVKPDNLHITLAFLGNVDAERLPEVGRIAAMAAGPGFTLVLDRVEFWPRNGIVCLAPSRTPQELVNLADCLAGRLGEAGFAMERRPYRAHLTLARKGRSEQSLIVLPKPVEWRIGSFNLVESLPDKEGAVYILREAWSLQDSETIPESPSMR